MVEQLVDGAVEHHDLNYYIALIRRRQLAFLIPFFFGWLLVWTASWILPASYTWGTQVRVSSDGTCQREILPNRLLAGPMGLH